MCADSQRYSQAPINLISFNVGDGFFPSELRNNSVSFRDGCGDVILVCHPLVRGITSPIGRLALIS